jgi:hypothetical protein
MEMLLGIIVRARPDGHLIDLEIEEAQWFINLYADVPSNIEFHSDSYKEHIRRKVAEKRIEWSPKHSISSISLWKKRIIQLKQADTYSAVQRYFSLLSDVEGLLTPIENIVGGIEAQAEMQIERNRSKR